MELWKQLYFASLILTILSPIVWASIGYPTQGMGLTYGVINILSITSFLLALTLGFESVKDDLTMFTMIYAILFSIVNLSVAGFSGLHYTLVVPIVFQCVAVAVLCITIPIFRRFKVTIRQLKLTPTLIMFIAIIVLLGVAYVVRRTPWHSGAPILSILIAIIVIFIILLEKIIR